MTSGEMAGLEVYVDDLAATSIKHLARSEVAEAIAEKVLEKYKDPFIKEVADSITMPEVRRRVIDRIVEETVRNWARERSGY